MCAEPSGTASYDRGFHSRFAPTGIRSCVAQSAAGVRAAYQLARSYRRCHFKEPQSADCDVDSGIHDFDFRMAGL